MTYHMNISIGCIILAQKRQISYSMKKPTYYFFDSTLGPVQYYNIHRTGRFIENRCTAWKKFHPFHKSKFTSEKVRSKPHLSTQWARVQVATYTQIMFNKIGNHCGWGKFESCLSDGQNELQVFFKPCSHWKFVRKKKNSQHFAKPPTVSPWNDVWGTSTEIPSPDIIWQGNWWKCRKMLLVFSGYWKSPHLNALQMQPMSLILSSFYSSFL